MNDYPKWIYAADSAAKIIQSEDEMPESGWYESPADVPAAEPDADPSESDAEGHTVESVRAKLDELNIAYDKRLGLAKLIALLPA